ncbi:MAG: adenylate/guanylate cyclase domain-containing protein [Anaerolineae bacterium]
MASPSSDMRIVAELQRGQALLAETLAALNAQRDALRVRGVALPSTVMGHLTALQDDFNRLETLIVEEQTELSQLRALAQMSASITTSLDIDTVLNEAMDIIIALTKAERGYIVLYDAASESFEVRIQREDTLMSRVARGASPSISSTVLHEVISTGQPLLTDNAYKDERLADGASIANFALRSVLCVPLNYREQVIGVVYVDNRMQSGVFTQRELTMLTAFSSTAAVAIANAMYYAEIQALLNDILQVKELMSSIFASISSGVIATDAQSHVTTFNRAAADMLNVDESLVLHQPLTNALPHLISSIHEELAIVRQTSQPVQHEGLVEVPGRGDVVISLSINPLQDGAGKLQGVALVLDDLTEEREREAQLSTIKTYLPAEMVDNIQAISSLALGGESREVTCMFVEVRGLHTLKDKHPREVLALLNEYFALATEAINSAGGIIDKYMGTEIMALFNTQLNPHPDHAARAVAAALAMRESFIAWYRDHQIDPQPHYYRIGMHTGVATLGNVGNVLRRDFTAIGDTINLAKRVEENTPYGVILLTEATRAHLAAVGSHAVRCEPRGELKAKGRAETTPIYEVYRA